MKDRFLKKIATRMVADKTYAPFGVYESEFFGYNDGSPAIIITKRHLRCPELARLLEQKARENGWDGCHWDHPEVISIDTTDYDEYRDQNPTW